jgi:hypothetical protein
MFDLKTTLHDIATRLETALPGLEGDGVELATQALADLKDTAETILPPAANAALTSAVGPVIAADLIPTLDPLIDEALAKVQSTAASQIEKLTALKTAIQPVAA